jgi:pimeloyl-ACP methyl ester carboxylesterase
MPHSRSCSFCTTSEQFIADALTATDYLRDRFGTDRVYLMAHSGGTFTALQTAARAPHRTAPHRTVGRREPFEPDDHPTVAQAENASRADGLVLAGEEAARGQFHGRRCPCRGGRSGGRRGFGDRARQRLVDPLVARQLLRLEPDHGCGCGDGEPGHRRPYPPPAPQRRALFR